MDGALGHGLADMRAAARQPAVVASTRASDLAACTRLVNSWFACDRRRPPVADVHQPFVGERHERVPYGAGFQSLELVQFGNRWESVTGYELARSDRCPQLVSGLLPRGSRIGRVGPEVRDVAVLGELLAGGREVAAPHQPDAQRVQQRAADLAGLHGPEVGFDGPANISEVAHPGGHVPSSCRHVLVEQLRHGDARVGLASRCGLLKQLAELDLRRPSGLTCLPQPDLPAGERVGPGVDLGTPGSARQLLYVSPRCTSHDTVGSTAQARLVTKLQVGRVGLEPTTGGL
jgi:hypothetical protein